MIKFQKVGADVSLISSKRGFPAANPLGVMINFQKVEDEVSSISSKRGFPAANPLEVGYALIMV